MQAGILITQHGVAVHGFGDIESCLLTSLASLPSPLADVLVADLKGPSATAIEQATRNATAIRRESFRMRDARGLDRAVQLSVEPLYMGKPESCFLLCLDFDHNPAEPDPSLPPATGGSGSNDPTPVLSESARAELRPAADKSSDKFVHAVAHDLTEPLRIMSSYSELLLRQVSHSDNEKVIRYATTVHEGAIRMQHMLDSLLIYSRVTTRGQAFVVIDLAEAVSRATSALSAALDAAGAEVRCKELPYLFGDREQIESVIYRLLDNAINFRHAARPLLVEISAKRHNSETIISVADNGIGIDESDHDRIFDMFVRLAHDKTTRGHGAGLAICRQIIEWHNGKLWCESSGPGGSVFSFRLPMAAQ